MNTPEPESEGYYADHLSGLNYALSLLNDKYSIVEVRDLIRARAEQFKVLAGRKELPIRMTEEEYIEHSRRLYNRGRAAVRCDEMFDAELAELEAGVPELAVDLTNFDLVDVLEPAPEPTHDEIVAAVRGLHSWGDVLNGNVAEDPPASHIEPNAVTYLQAKAMLIEVARARQ